MIHMKSFEAVCCGKATVSGESARETKGGSMRAILFIYF